MKMIIQPQLDRLPKTFSHLSKVMNFGQTKVINLTQIEHFLAEKTISQYNCGTNSQGIRLKWQFE